MQVREERIPLKWAQEYKESYTAWKRGEEIPLNGTPIKGWSVLSPSQQANVIAANVRTVEDLAQANGEAVARIGMGGMELRQKAEAWIKAAKDVGITVQENIALKAKVSTLEEQVSRQALQIKELVKELEGAKVPG